MRRGVIVLLIVPALLGCDNPRNLRDDGVDWERRRVLHVIDSAIQRRIAAGNIPDAKLLSGLRSQVEAER